MGNTLPGANFGHQRSDLKRNATKMPDAHWLTEARLKGSKVIVISNDYSPTSRAADEVIVLRTGTDTALAYALAHVIMKEQRYQADYVRISPISRCCCAWTTARCCGPATLSPTTARSR